MLVRLFGGVSVASDGDWIPAGPAKRQCVLAALAVAPGTPVTLAELTSRVWGSAAPSSAHSSLYGHMTWLRRLLPDGLSRAGVDGYRLDVDPGLVDVHRVRRLATEARRLREDGEPGRAVERWREAAALVRGEALAGIEGDWASGIRTALHREHQELMIELYQTELELGHHREIVGELSELVARYPVAEPLVGLLMTALYRCQRSLEALECYARLRTRLAEEFGTEPSPPLRRLQRDILNEDAELEPAPSAGPVRVPAQLPADTTAFTGREPQLRTLLDAAADSRVIVVDGMAGIGKTTLAVHAARRLAEHYPDGQLYLNLHSFTDAVPPMTPAEALSVLLDSLGVPRKAIPEGVDARAAAFRSMLVGRRVLLLLDNARDEAQLLPLLPGDTGCLTVITSRRRLSGLDDIRPVSLDPLGPESSARLFTAAAGLTEPDDVDRGAVGRIVEVCGGLPLAIRIAAARLRSRPTWSTTDLLDRLSKDYRLLEELTAGSRSIASTLELSYRELSDEQRRLFRLLALCPGSDFDPATAAALLGASVDELLPGLETLVDVSLVGAEPGGRYRMHDLIRHFAAEALARDETDSRPAVDRLRSHFLHHAHAAVKVLNPDIARLPNLPPLPSGIIRPRLSGHAAALSWFAAEESAVLSLLSTSLPDAPGLVLDLAACVLPYLRDHSASTAQPAVASLAVQAARAEGDTERQAIWLNLLGNAHFTAARFEPAVRCYTEALEIHNSLGNMAGAAAIHGNLGVVHKELGDLARSLSHLEQAAQMAASADSAQSVAIAETNACEVHVRLGNASRGRELAESALERFRDLDRPLLLAQTYDNLAMAYLAENRLADARRAEEEAIDYGRRHDTIEVLVQALSRLGTILRVRGDLSDALVRHQEALMLLSPNSRPVLETGIQCEYGRTLLATGDPETALTQFRQAATLAGNTGQRYELAMAEHGIADTLTATGDAEAARPHYETALRLYTRMGIPVADDIRERLAA